jgi:hypothetical protein
MNNFLETSSTALEPVVSSMPANILLYVVMALIALFIGFMLMNKNVVISDIFLFFIPHSFRVYYDAKMLWPPSGNIRNMVAYKSNFGNSFQDASYSILMDLKLLNSRTNNTQPTHRHIFHRGSDEYSSASSSATNSLSGNLPRRMNPGVFMDPITNDLLIFVDTVNAGQSYRESLRIPDIPLKTAFRLGITVKGQVLDVYIDCKLEDTKFLQGTPKPVEMTMYGEAGPNPAPASLQNVYVWSHALNTIDVTSLCSTAPSFIDNAATCATLPPAAAPEVATSLNNVPLINVLQSAFGAGTGRATNTILGQNMNLY